MSEILGRETRHFSQATMSFVKVEKYPGILDDRPFTADICLVIISDTRPYIHTEVLTVKRTTITTGSRGVMGLPYVETQVQGNKTV